MNNIIPYWDEELLKKMAGGNPIIVKTIPFTNNDVPEYLEKYKRFIEESKKVIINVGL